MVWVNGRWERRECWVLDGTKDLYRLRFTIEFGDGYIPSSVLFLTPRQFINFLLSDGFHSPKTYPDTRV